MFAVYLKATPAHAVAGLEWVREDDFDNGQELALAIGFAGANPARVFETQAAAEAWVDSKTRMLPIGEPGGRPAWAGPYNPWPSDFEVRPV